MAPDPRSRPLAVPTYHRIGNPAAAPPGIVSATPGAFARQMRWLAASGRAVALADVLAAAAGAAPLRSGAVLVTFDDAYADFATHAWPVLRRHRIPVTLFVPTAFPDGRAAAFWWDRLHAALSAARAPLATPLGRLELDRADARARAYRALRAHVNELPHDEAMALVDDLVARLGGPDPPARVLSWAQLRALAAEGVTLAPHTRTHARLDRVAPERAADEVHGSLADLRANAGHAAPAFAYPAGGVSGAARAAVRAAGIEVAFTTTRGIADLRDERLLELPRINVGRRTSTALLRAQLAAPAPALALAAARERRRRPQPLQARDERPAVAYVMSRFPKISETFILTEILALERRGVRVEVYPLLRERAALIHPEAAAVVARAHYLPFVSRAVLASQLHWLRRAPRAYLGAVRDVASATRGSLNFLAGGLAIVPKVAHAARLMQDAGVAHVHCHFANHPAVAGLVIGRLTGLPYSFTAHGSDLHVERRMLPEKVAEAAFVSTISDDNRRLIVSECGGRFADKVHVVRAGIDTTLFAPHRNGGRPPGPLRVVCVGTLHEVKGQAHLVEACRLLAAGGVDVACRLIGDGPDRRRLQRAVAEAGLTGRVELAGARTRAEVAAELTAADVLVAPSVPTRRGRREGIPVVLMEAMSSGLAVVASDLSGIPELVDDGASGLLVPPGNAHALAAALRALAGDPALRGRLGARGRERVLEEFDAERTAAQLARRFGLERAA
jgi:glycosyltransferase involved in cell wall biosynthesis/peptidoglycan/xylan/chitin deacetylase (PgdA/CDA1 family)